MTHPAVSYWDHGIDAVQRRTGAADSIMDGSDIRGVCADLGIALPCPNVLDVGCGTGRVSVLCDGYFGVDIAPSAVAYCQQRGLLAALISGPEDLPTGPFDCWFDWVWACSMFTHIGREEQRAYLKAFIARAPHLLVDILPGDRHANYERWGTDEAEFLRDLDAAGYRVRPERTDRIDTAGGAHHRYFVADRRA